MSPALTGLIWFHRDLRTSDHAGLERVRAQGGSWAALVVSPEERETAACRFVKECHGDLEASLSSFHIPLMRIPESDVKSFLQDALRANPGLLLLTSRRYNSRDQDFLTSCANGIPESQRLIYDHGTLYRESDLPFPLSALPATFTPFQKKLRSAHAPIHPPSGSLHPPNGEGTLSIPEAVTLQEGAFHFRGGERFAHLRLRDYFEKTRAVLHYHETRNGLLARDDSSKLSPYLAQGCISARQIHARLLPLLDSRSLGSQDGARVPPPGPAALLYELEWRDYFKFLAACSGERFFQITGLKGHEPDTTRNRELFDRWCRGETGNHFVDANMRELLTSGWMSNRGRQNVASFLSKTLKLPWLWGAEWFEKNLIDFDPETNQGNWLYLAGVGTDPRDRVFNPDLQAERYDPKGEYRKRWLTAPTKPAA